jgi:2-oxoglutarate dehydrogenase E2 component (dihydrolipoamide succinyltransferase)
MHDVQIPALGESITEAVIVRLLKQDGERVALDEPILELETDKASVEIPSPAAGVIHFARAEGDTVRVGETVATIEVQGRNDPSPETKAADDPAAAASTHGDTAAGTTERPDSDGATAAVVDGDGPSARPDAAALPPSPAVRRLVEEHDVELASVEGTGRSGRVTKADVLRHLGERGTTPTRARTELPAEPTAPRSPTPYPAGTPPTSSEADVTRTPMTRLRRRIAERLLEAQRGAAILTTFNEVDMTAVLDLRKRFQQSFEDRHGSRLGFMSFFAKACVAAMADVPLLNAHIEADDVVQPDYVHLGVAVGTPRGLVVPVLHHAERMSFADVENTIGRLANLARDNKLSIADLSGGTFTISNGGVYGSLLSTPILNPPQSGILGLHKIEKRPVVVDDQIVIRPMMYLALSYDHRLVDGAEAVTFLVRVKERIEAPERLLLEV